MCKRKTVKIIIETREILYEGVEIRNVKENMLSCIWLQLLSLTLLLPYQAEGKPRIKVIFPEDDELQENTLNEPSLPSIHRNQTYHFKLWNNIKPPNLQIDVEKVKCADSGATFCEQIDENLYPTEYVENMLKQNSKSYQNYFNSIKSVSVPKIDEELSLRIDKSMSMAIEFCKSEIRTIYPKIAMNIENSWNYVINQRRFRQAIQIELCEHSGEPCLFSNLFPIGYKTKCTQKFMKQPLLGMDSNGNLREYSYRFPSHCQCELFI